MARVVCSYKYDKALSFYLADMSDQFNGVRIAYYTLVDENGNEHKKTSAIFGGDVTAGGDVTINELIPGTYYSATVDIYNYANNEHLAKIEGYGATTFPTAPQVTCVANAKSVSLTIMNGGGNCEGYCWKIAQGENVIEEEIVMGGGTFTRTIENLEENMIYTIQSYSFIYLSDGTMYYDEASYSETIYFNTNGEIPSYEDDDFSVTMFRPVQTKLGELCAEVGIEGENLKGCTYIIYHYDSGGNLIENTRGIFKQNGGIVYIYFSEFRRYTLSLEVLKGNSTVSKKNSVIISENCIKNMSFMRINRGIYFSWDVSPDNYDEYTYSFNGWRYPNGKINELFDSFWNKREYILSNLECAKTYVFSLFLQGTLADTEDEIYDDIGEWSDNYIATAPSQPTALTAHYTDNNIVSIEWELEEENENDVQLRVNIYKSGGVVFSYDIDVLAKTTKGSSLIEVGNLENGDYEVRISTHYGDIWCVDENGTGFFVSANLKIDSAKPSEFKWLYPKLSGQAVNITAVEWQALTSKINEFRRYCGIDNFIFETTAITGNVITNAVYNEVAEAVRDILEYSADIDEIENVEKGQNMTAASLNILKEAINSI